MEAGHDVLDRAVLAGRVHPLEDDEDPSPALRPEALLELGEAADVGGDLGRRAVLVVAEGRAGVERADVHLRAGANDEAVAERSGSTGLGGHAATIDARPVA